MNGVATQMPSAHRSSPPPSSIHSGRRHWWGPAAALFAVAWSGNEFTPLLTMYRRTDGLSLTAVNALLAAYVLGIIPAMLIGGPLSDRFGRRPLLRPAPLVGIAGSLLIGVGGHAFAALFVGRILCGIALGLGMAVGTSWVKELSEPPWETNPHANGARRASLSMTAGFALGAAVAAVLAQFAPLPLLLSYAVATAVAVAAFFLVSSSPETVANGARGALVDDLRIPSAGRRRFWLVLGPSAPWVFGCAAVAYAVLPALVSKRVGEYGVLFSGAACLVGLGCGFAIQPLGRVLDREGTVRGLTAALAVIVAAMLVAAVAADLLNLALLLVASAVLGCGYGLVLVTGLTEVQRIAGPTDLAGLTAVFYCLAYLGFFAPMTLSILNGWLSYPAMLAIGALIAGGGLLVLRTAHAQGIE